MQAATAVRLTTLNRADRQTINPEVADIVPEIEVICVVAGWREPKRQLGSVLILVRGGHPGNRVVYADIRFDRKLSSLETSVAIKVWSVGKRLALFAAAVVLLQI